MKIDKDMISKFQTWHYHNGEYNHICHVYDEDDNLVFYSNGEEQHRVKKECLSNPIYKIELFVDV